MDDEHTPLWIGRPAGDGFEERDSLEAEVQQINQAHAERCEQVKRLTQKMATCKTRFCVEKWKQKCLNNEQIKHSSISMDHIMGKKVIYIILKAQ